MKKLLLLTLLFLTIVSAKAELKEGKYSWFSGGSQAYLTITKKKNNNYHIVGECLYGAAFKGSPNMGDLEFTAPLKNGKIIHVDEEYGTYTFILTVNKDGSFDVDEKGESHFGHNATFYGHFTSTDLPSFSCNKAHSFVEHAICDNVEIARLDKQMATLYALYWRAFFFKDNREKLEKTLKEEQHTWLKKRNKCEYVKGYKSCLKKSYNKRMKTMEKELNHFWGYDD